MHLTAADVAVSLGGQTAAESYLRGDFIIATAKQTVRRRSFLVMDFCRGTQTSPRNVKPKASHSLVRRRNRWNSSVSNMPLVKFTTTNATKFVAHPDIVKSSSARFMVLVQGQAHSSTCPHFGTSCDTTRAAQTRSKRSRKECHLLRQ